MARDEPIVRPARTDEWQVVAADKGVAEGWDRWAKQEPNTLAAASDKPTTGPTQFSSRQCRLEGKTMGTGVYEGRTLDRWQYEVTAAAGSSTSWTTPPTADAVGRSARAAAPKPRRRVIIEAVHPGHPKQTERKRG